MALCLCSQTPPPSFFAVCKKERLELEPGYAAHLYGSYMYSVLVLVMLSFQKTKNKFLPANQSTVHVQLDYFF